LYEDASITRKEMLVLLNAYFFRHNSSQSGVSDMLKIASLLVPKGESACIPPTYFKFMANLNTDISKAKKHFFCKTCAGPVTTFGVKCHECDTINEKKELDASDQYFYTLNIESVLKFVLEIPSNGEDVLQNLEEREMNLKPAQTFKDIMDGDAYKKLGISLSNYS